VRIKRPKRYSIIDTCASSDLAFLLIIYFLVIAGFNINIGFLMDLPSKNSTRLILKDDLMRFDMDSRGMLIYQNTELSMSRAEHEIRTAIEGHPNLAVVLSISGDAPWQQVVLFVELANKLEVEAFSFSLGLENQLPGAQQRALPLPQENT